MNERPKVKVGLISLGVGLTVAGIGAAIGVAAERVAMGRPLLPGFGTEDDDPEDYGQLHVPGIVVTTADGVPLHVEVDETDVAVEVDETDEVHESTPVTVIFSHGYGLAMDSWHFQRKALRGRYRLVCWDQRGHGRSGTGAPESATIDQVGADLEAVIDAVAPQGPLVLIGHSMGGMTVMALAERRPELFAERVLAVGLVATSAGGIDQTDLGLATVGRMLLRVAPGMVRTLARAPRLVGHGRRWVSDLEAVLVRRFSFGSPVSAALLRFTALMIASTDLGVISDFLPTLSDHDKRTALAALNGLEVLVLVGDHDLLTPAEHSDDIVRALPGAEYIVVRQGGHLVMLEHPDVVTGHLIELIERSLRSLRSMGHESRPRSYSLVRRTVTSLRHRGRGHGKGRKHDGVA